MNFKKKILIVGSIADFGGREVEVKNIIDALVKDFDVRLFSTVPITKKSMAIKDSSYKWTSVHKELYKSNLLLKGLALLNKKWNKSALPSYLLVSNKISSVFFNFNAANLRILKKQIDSVETILFCGVFTNGYLKEIISYCLELNKPLMLRITGTITDIPKDIKALLPKITFIIVHSNSNAHVLRSLNLKNVRIIDQTTLAEKSLMEITINKSNEIVFGYIGRFSSEKGIIELLDIFETLDKRLIVAGNGPLLAEIKASCANSLFIEYIGEIPTNRLVEFFDKVDVLIIPSFEETGPLVGIEAMAAGKLIFSTRVGAMLERLENTGNNFWFDIDNRESFIQLIEELKQKSPEEIKKIREANRTKYLEYYSVTTIARKYLDTFQNNI